MQAFLGSVLQHQHHLEERIAAGVALRAQRLDQLLERQVLVGEGLQALLPNAGQQLAHGGISVEPGPQDQGVHKEADQTFDLGAIPIRHRRADEQILLTGVAREQDGKPGQKGREERDALAPRQGPEVVGQLSWKSYGEPCAPVALHRGARPIRGKLEYLGRA